MKTGAQPNRRAPQSVRDAPAYPPRAAAFKRRSSRIASRPKRIRRSTEKKKVANSAAMIITITVVSPVSRRVGQTTLAVSARTCWMNCRGLVRAIDRTLAGRTAAPRPGAGALQGRTLLDGPARSGPWSAGPAPPQPPRIRTRMTDEIHPDGLPTPRRYLRHAGDRHRHRHGGPRRHRGQRGAAEHRPRARRLALGRGLGDQRLPARHRRAAPAARLARRAHRLPPVYQVGIALFTLGSLACALSHSLPTADRRARRCRASAAPRS